MTVQDMQTLYDYGWWARDHLFRVLSRLDTEQLTRSVGGSYGSVRNTLVHTLSAEWGWLERCGGHARGPALEADDFPDLASLQTMWKKVEAEFRAYLAGLKDQDLDRIVEFKLGSGAQQAMPLRELLHHGATHGVHHRGQVAMMLRMLGVAPGNFDLLFYYGGRRGQ